MLRNREEAGRRAGGAPDEVDVEAAQPLRVRRLGLAILKQLVHRRLGVDREAVDAGEAEAVRHLGLRVVQRRAAVADGEAVVLAVAGQVAQPAREVGRHHTLAADLRAGAV